MSISFTKIVFNLDSALQKVVSEEIFIWNTKKSPSYDCPLYKYLLYSNIFARVRL